ncbi:MAG: isoaspartyl peptidase/L-asparaginase [Flavipsychrobacter sp.]|nr:isoaspartyl peptidase/L-asparaginase [Flavipsychrobacter sp.]
MVIHGGAGSLTPGSVSPGKEAAYRHGMQKALNAGNRILKNGGTATDAVVAAIKVLEDDSLFNAGKGAVFTAAGRNELDASIMDGKTLKAGAVAGVTTVKNPITAARAVMDKSPHVLMAGKGAELFAEKQGCTIMPASYFRTEEQYNTIMDIRRAEQKEQEQKHGSLRQPENPDFKYGTVGAVALDKYGNLAAGTSTGGMTNKSFGRIGDSPIIGAGTYANNNTCAISCTGWGEYFIRLVMAKSISDRIELAHMSLDDAANEMMMKRLPELGGDGGMIGLDRKGNIVNYFNTPGMFRAYIKWNGESAIEMYRK